MASFKDQLDKLTSSRWWDSSLLVGLAIAIMIYTRFMGLSEPYIKAFDPYYFWRVAETIWHTGVWQGADALRYFPFGWQSQELAPLVPHTLVYLGRIAGNLKAGVKFYPAMIGVLSIVSMALLGKRLGMSGLSSLILAIIPAYMFRTSQGFADKEPLGFFLGILGWYFAATALKEKKILPAVFSGMALGAVATVWGGKVLFVFSLVPLFGLLFLKEDYKRAALLSVSFIVYVLMEIMVPRYTHIILDPINIGLIGIAGFGIINYLVYKAPQLEKYGKKRMLITMVAGAVLVALTSLIIYKDLFYVVSFLMRTFEKPVTSGGAVVHGDTVAENQKAMWTWDLVQNQYYGQFGFFFFIALGVLILPILTKAWKLIRNNAAVTQDYVYAGALLLASGYIVYTWPGQTPVMLFLLGIPGMLENEDIKTLMVNSIVAFSMYSAVSAIRLFTFTSTGVAIGGAYILTILLKHKDTVAKVAGYVLLIYAFYQILPSSIAFANGLSGTSLTPTWFENAKWMEFNVPHGEPVVTWWDYGYWIQTLGNTTTLGDGANVGPGYTENWYTGHFFATDDYENATAWVKEWNLTYFTVDSAMLPKFWAYSTLGGISNVLNQIRYQKPYPTDFGIVPIYAGVSDDYGPVAVAELTINNEPVYLLGRIVNGAISWIGVIDEFSYFSQKGALVCDPIGYCKSSDFGNYQRLNQSVVIYPNQMIILGDQHSMHSMFARLWFFEGYNTDFKLLLSNGETKTFKYVG